MEFVATKKFNLSPIANIKFGWIDTKKNKNIYIGEIDIKHETSMTIDVKTHKGLVKEMKKAKSDLLTDGTYFFTTIGEDKITQINHPSFYQALMRHATNSDITVVDTDEPDSLIVVKK